MQGGADPVILTQWLELARAEPDAKRRADYGGLALVFAEAAGRQSAWKEALRGWNVVESQQVLEWIAEGKVEGKVESLLQVLESRFPPGAPADLAAQIRATTDADQLTRWIAAAATAPSLEAFQQAMTPKRRGSGQSGKKR